MFEEAFADFSAVYFGGGEDGLEVHGLPDGAGFDILGLEREPDLFAGNSRNLGVDGQAGEPAGRLTPRGFGLHGHAWKRFEGLGVGLEVAAATRDFAREARELAESDTGGDIAEAIVIADGGMLVMRRGVPGLGREKFSLFGEFRIIGDQHAPSPGGDDFIAVEGMDADKAKGTRRGFSIGRAQGLGGVFDEFDAMLIATGFDGGDVRRLAVEVHKDKRLGRLTGLGFLFDDGAREGGIHVPTLFFRVDEDGLGAEIGDG